MREESVLHDSKDHDEATKRPSLIAFIANWGLGLSGLWQCLPDGLRWPSERQLLALVPVQRRRSGSERRYKP